MSARAVRRRRGRLRRGWRRRRRRARRPRPERPAPRGGPAPHRRRLHALGGEGEPRLLVAAPFRPDRRWRRWASSRSSRRAASAGRRRSTRRSRSASTTTTTRNGTRQAVSSAPTGRRSARAISTRTTNASRGASASACDPTGARACTRSSPASGRSGRISSPCMRTPTRNCMSCGSCLQGCPTNAGKSTMNTYIHDAWATGRLELRAESPVQRVVVEDGEARGVEYVDGEGALRRVEAGAVVVAAGTLNTPQLLLRSGLPDSPSTGSSAATWASIRSASSTGCSTSRRTRTWSTRSPPTAMDHQRDEDGGFVIEATTIQDPISFATTLEDESGPLWGQQLVEAVRKFRHWVGLLAMVNDENNGTVSVDEGGAELFAASFNEREQRAPGRRPRSSRATCSRPRARRRSAGPASRRLTSRGPAAWAAIPSARWSTQTGAYGASNGSTSATARSCRGPSPSIRR